MKKITAILLLVSILASAFVSCGREEPQAEYVNDRYFYETIYLTDSGYSVIVEFDAVSKSARIPCPDPLCDHGEGCLVSHIKTTVDTSKNMAYFKKNDNYYVLDSSKTKISQLFDSSKSVIYGPYQGPDSIVYFVVQEYEYSDTGEMLSTVYNVYRYDEQKEKLSKLTEEPLRENISFRHCTEKNIIWYFSSDRKYYSTDLDFKNKEPYTAPDNEVQFKFENGVAPYSGNATDIYIIQPNGEKTPILEKVSTFRFANRDTKDAIFYFPAKLIQSGIDEKTGKPTFWYAADMDKLIYKNIYDESDTYVWEFPKGEGPITAACFSDNNRNAGDYVAFPYSKSYVNEDGNRWTRSGIFVVNIKTKESFSIVYGDENTRVIY